MENAREARRKKILERGSDRLALITGQARSFPGLPSPPPPPEKDEHPQDLVAPSSNDDGTSSQLPDKYDSSSDTSRTARERSENEISNGISKFHENDDVPVDNKEDDMSTYEQGNGVEVKELQYEQERSSEEVTATVVSTARMKKQLPFSSRQISCAVSASENMRLLCAITISLLVVMSNSGFALDGRVLRSIASFRPLFLVMLTDLTIILWLLMTRQETDDKGKERTRTGTQESSGRIGDTFAAMLVFHNAARSVFMDCSICAVIVISGLCIYGSHGCVAMLTT